MFIYYLLVGVLLTKTPYIGKYFRLFNTLIHEIGHVLMSIILRGKAYRIDLYPDTSGTALTGSRSKFRTILVSLSGYPFSSLIAYLMIILLIRDGYENYSYVMYGIMAIMVISLLLWVRNGFGVGWLLIFLGVTVILEYYGNATIIIMYVKTVVAILFVESVTSSFELLNLTIRQPEESGDASVLRKYTGIPEVIWGILFVVISLIPLVKVFSIIF